MSTQTKTFLTPEDLLAHPREKDYELVDGELVERHESEEEGHIGFLIVGELYLAIKGTDLGWAYVSDTGFICRSTGQVRVRKPDAAFISKSRLPNGPKSRGYGEVIPDLVAEVVSPNDLATDVDLKVQEWLREGVSVVWVVWPRTRAVVIHQRGQQPLRLTDGDQLTLEGLIPNFSCDVSTIFPPISDASNPNDENR